MDDRVGDLLAQRVALHDGAAAGIAVSLLLHGALTAFAIWAALHHAAAQTPRTIEIRFAQIPRAVVATSAIAPAAPKPSKLEKPAPVLETKPVTPAKPEKNTVPLSPFGKSEKKGSEHATPSVATAPPAVVPGVSAAVPVGGAGVTGLEGGDFPYTLYIE